MYSRIWQRINRFQTVVMVIITTQRFDTTRQSHTRNDTHIYKRNRTGSILNRSNICIRMQQSVEFRNDGIIRSIL